MAFLPTKPTAELYSSRESDYPGVGFPSCSRALARLSKFYNDTNFYYADLGIPPWANTQEIKSALREAYRRYHPDGTHPDPELFMRFKEIGEVLLNSELKGRYDDTREDQVFIDSQIRSFLVGEGIAVEQVVEPFESPKEVEDHETFYDYFSFGEDPWDMLKAQEWYACLVAVAPLCSWTGPIKVLLHDGDPDWLHRTRMMMIPRWWNPNNGNAFALFSHFVGVA